MIVRILISVSIIVYAIVLHALLIDLFPNPGPTTIGTFPLTLLLVALIALINYFVFHKIRGSWKRLIYVIATFAGLTFITVGMYPQEQPFKQVAIAYDLYKNPHKVRYEDLFRANYQMDAVYVTAALHQFRDSIPDQAFRITYCCNDFFRYYIAKYGDKYVTNNEKLMIDSLSKSDTVIFRDTYDGESIVFSDPPHVFGNRTGWGHYIDFETRKNTISYSEVDFKPLSGFNKIYYKVLE